MNASTGIEWIAYNHWPDCTVWVDRKIPGYYSLAYGDNGPVHWSMNHGPLEKLPSPVAWWTWPDVWWNFGSRDGVPWDHRFVNFRGPRAESWKQNGLLPIPNAAPWTPIRKPDAFRGQWDQLFRELARPLRHSARAEHLLEGILLALQEERQSSEASGPYDGKIRLMAQQMRRHPEKEWRVGESARTTGLSDPHFRKVFRACMGISPSQYVVRSRLQKAADLLRSSALPIKTIAEQTGHSDVYYFSRQFKNVIGQSPGRYRKAARME